MANKHAVLSASSSERWLNCTPSARLCENYEDKGSDYAAEGTDAHTLCEFRLKQALGMPTEDPIENLSWYNEEMEECAAGYAAYVVELLETAKQTCTEPVVMIEQRVNFSRWVQDGFGTADCIVIADGVMNICDYKHGKGVEVSAVANPQMMLYALGALEIFDDMPFSRQSAERNGPGGNWSKAVPIASTPVKPLLPPPWRVRASTPMSAKSSASLPCRRCSANPALRNFSLPTLKSRKVNRRSCRRATNVRQ